MLYYIPQYKTSTLSTPGGIDDTTTSGIKITDVTGIDISKPGIACLSYTNPLNLDNAEFFTYTSIDGTNTFVGVTRGQEGISSKAHSNGVTIGFVYSKSHLNSINDLLSGITEGIKVKNSIQDASGNEVIKTPATSSAVNEITVTNASTTNSPTISATGDDTNIDLKLSPKGTGSIVVTSPLSTPKTYGAITTDTDQATVTMDMAVSRHQVTLGGNRTLVLSNITTGQVTRIDLIQDSTGSRTVTWPSFGATATVTIATPGVLTTGKDIPTLTPIILTTTGALPTGLTASTVYYYVRVNATTGNLATSVANAQAGTYIATSGTQSGVHTCAVQIRWPSQTAPTLSTGKYAKDKINLEVIDATNTVIEGMVAGAF